MVVVVIERGGGRGAEGKRGRRGMGGWMDVDGCWEGRGSLSGWWVGWLIDCQVGTFLRRVGVEGGVGGGFGTLLGEEGGGEEKRGGLDGLKVLRVDLLRGEDRRSTRC